MDYNIIFTLNIAATIYMTGVIWLVQLVLYPHFAHYDKQSFTKTMNSHQSRITWVVAPPMLLELATGLLLLLYPQHLPYIYSIPLFILIIINWLSTFFLQVPLHEKLTKEGYNNTYIQKLVQTNWLRTFAWSLRTIILTYLIFPPAF